MSQMMVGLDLLSSATSPKERCTELLQASWLSTVISRLRNTEKTVQQAVHNMMTGIHWVT